MRRSALFAALLLTSGLAFATPNFPAAVQSAEGTPSLPPCALCHFNGVTGAGTVTTPIGKSLKARGMVGSDAAALGTALARLGADGVDSDGDGVTDIAELKAGTDPNVPNANPDGGVSGSSGTVAILPPPPVYGCAGVPDGPLAGLALGLALPGFRRRARG